MDPYYEIDRKAIEPDVRRIKVMNVPGFINWTGTTLERDKRLKDEFVIVARKELKRWEMTFAYEKKEDGTLCVYWNFGYEDPRILELLSFTIRVHPDDYDRVDFPGGKKVIIPQP